MKVMEQELDHLITMIGTPVEKVTEEDLEALVEEEEWMIGIEDTRRKGEDTTVEEVSYTHFFLNTETYRYLDPDVVWNSFLNGQSTSSSRQNDDRRNAKRTESHSDAFPRQYHEDKTQRSDPSKERNRESNRDDRDSSKKQEKSSSRCDHCCDHQHRPPTPLRRTTDSPENWRNPKTLNNGERASRFGRFEEQQEQAQPNAIDRQRAESRAKRHAEDKGKEKESDNQIYQIDFNEPTSSIHPRRSLSPTSRTGRKLDTGKQKRKADPLRGIIKNIRTNRDGIGHGAYSKDYTDRLATWIFNNRRIFNFRLERDYWKFRSEEKELVKEELFNRVIPEENPRGVRLIKKDIEGIYELLEDEEGNADFSLRNKLHRERIAELLYLNYGDEDPGQEHDDLWEKLQEEDQIIQQEIGSIWEEFELRMAEIQHARNEDEEGRVVMPQTNEDSSSTPTYDADVTILESPVVPPTSTLSNLHTVRPNEDPTDDVVPGERMDSQEDNDTHNQGLNQHVYDDIMDSGNPPQQEAEEHRGPPDTQMSENPEEIPISRPTPVVVSLETSPSQGDSEHAESVDGNIPCSSSAPVSMDPDEELAQIYERVKFLESIRPGVGKELVKQLQADGDNEGTVRTDEMNPHLEEEGIEMEEEEDQEEVEEREELNDLEDEDFPAIMQKDVMEVHDQDEEEEEEGPPMKKSRLDDSDDEEEADPTPRRESIRIKEQKAPKRRHQEEMEDSDVLEESEASDDDTEHEEEDHQWLQARKKKMTKEERRFMETIKNIEERASRDIEGIKRYRDVRIAFIRNTIAARKISRRLRKEYQQKESSQGPEEQ